MPGMDPLVEMHRLNINPATRPVKQHERRFRPKIIEAIEAEVKKLMDFGLSGRNNIQSG